MARPARPGHRTRKLLTGPGRARSSALGRARGHARGAEPGAAAAAQPPRRGGADRARTRRRLPPPGARNLTRHAPELGAQARSRSFPARCPQWPPVEGTGDIKRPASEVGGQGPPARVMVIVLVEVPNEEFSGLRSRTRTTGDMHPRNVTPPR